MVRPRKVEGFCLSRYPYALYCKQGQRWSLSNCAHRVVDEADTPTTVVAQFLNCGCLINSDHHPKDEREEPQKKNHERSPMVDSRASLAITSRFDHSRRTPF